MVLTAAVLAALGLALARRWDDVRPLLDQLSPAAAAGAFGYCLLGLVASMLAWRALLGDLGNPLPVRPATRVLFLGQLAKYLPGSTVWAVLAQTELAHDYGVPRKRASSSTWSRSVSGCWSRCWRCRSCSPTARRAGCTGARCWSRSGWPA